MDIGGAGIPPACNNGLQVQGFTLGIRYRNVNHLKNIKRSDLDQKDFAALIFQRGVLV